MNVEKRTCEGSHDGCLDGDGRVDGRSWPPRQCTTSSTTDDCRMTYCDRSFWRNCRCVEVTCSANNRRPERPPIMPTYECDPECDANKTCDVYTGTCEDPLGDLVP